LDIEEGAAEKSIEVQSSFESKKSFGFLSCVGALRTFGAGTGVGVADGLLVEKSGVDMAVVKSTGAIAAAKELLLAAGFTDGAKSPSRESKDLEGAAATGLGTAVC